MSNINKKTNIFKKYRFRIMAVVFLIILSIFGTSFILFKKFETVFYRSLQNTNHKFSQKIDMHNQAINNMVENFLMQTYYSRSAKTLMNASDKIPLTKRTYLMRDINGFTATSDFVDQVYIYNSNTDTVYSTGSVYPELTILNLKDKRIENLLKNRDPNKRFVPIYLKAMSNTKKPCYAFLFFENLKNPKKGKGTLLITVDGEWYKNMLMADDDDLTVLDRNFLPVISSNDEYIHYIDKIAESKDTSNYILSPNKNKICIFCKSPLTGYIYIKIADKNVLMPELMSFKHSVDKTLLILGIILLMILIIYIYKFILPTLHIKEGYKNMNLEKNLLDIFSESLIADPLKIFSKEDFENKYFSIMLVRAPHRKDIYLALEKNHPELICCKTPEFYAAALTVKDIDDINETLELLSVFKHTVIVSELFTDFSTISLHYRNLCELYNIRFLQTRNGHALGESVLYEKTKNASIKSRDFSELKIKLKQGSHEASIEKYNELINQMRNFRYRDLKYLIYRLEEIIVASLIDIKHSEYLNENGRIVPKNLCEIKNFTSFNTSFIKAINCICNEYKNQKEAENSKRGDNIKKYIEENCLDKNLSTRSVAEHFDMNSAYLGRLFKKAFDNTISGYINSCRIEKAKSELKDSNRCIDDIAVSVGFSTDKYFYQVFKKFTGMTPAKYREKYEKEKKNQNG